MRLTYWCALLLILALAPQTPATARRTAPISIAPSNGVAATERVLKATTQIEETYGSNIPEGLRVNEAYGTLPLSFEVNRGQTDSQVDFISRGTGYTLFLTPGEAVLTLSAEDRHEQPQRRFGATLPSQLNTRMNMTVIRMQFVGADTTARPAERDKLPGTVSYFRGSDPTRWHTKIPTYAKVGYYDIYPGIDIVYYGNQRQLEYDFVVAPGADPADIALSFEGANVLEVDIQGNLFLQTPTGDQVTQRPPIVYQQIGSVRTNIPSRYTVHDRASARQSVASDADPERQIVHFEIGYYDPNYALIIDPVLVYGTYLGGSGDETGRAIAVDAAGNAYVSGNSHSIDFPGTEGSRHQGGEDAFVTKLDATGSVVLYSTYLGGRGLDYSYGLAVDGAGSAYATGYTLSSDFPTTAGAFDRTHGGNGFDAFVTKLEPSGAGLAYSTFLGGSADEWGGADDGGRGITVDSNGNAYVTGITGGSDFPTTPAAFDRTFGGLADAFVTKLEADGSALAYSTYLGGAGWEEGRGIAMYGGEAYVSGITQSSDFPTTAGAFDTSLGGPADVFVTKLDSNGAALAYSSYLGGSDEDRGFGIGIDSAGCAYLTGITKSADFPTTEGAFERTYGAGYDSFVTKIQPNGAALVYSTYLRGSLTDPGIGSHYDVAIGITVDNDGNAYVVGGTQSSDFPTTAGAFGNGTGFDVFVTKLATNGTLTYSTYLPGSGYEEGDGIAVDHLGNAYVTGTTGSTDFPTTFGAFDVTPNGGRDVFVVQLQEGGSGEPNLQLGILKAQSVAGAGLPFAVTDRTTNVGTAPALVSATKFYLSINSVWDAADRLLEPAAGRRVPNLYMGVSSTGTTNLTIPADSAPGKRFLIAYADASGTVAELNEADNTKVKAIYIGPDLTVSNLISAGSATAGEAISVTDTTKNSGGASTAAITTTQLYLSVNKGLDRKDVLLGPGRHVPALAPGTSSVLSTSVTIPPGTPTGAYYLLAKADDDGVEPESRETNNVKAVPITIK